MRALPTLPREDQYVGGQALRRIRYQRLHPVAQLGLVVGGHKEVVPWPGVGQIQPLQGGATLFWRRGGVCAISESRKGSWDLSCYCPRLDTGSQSPQVHSNYPGNLIPSGLRPFGTQLEGNHDVVGGQGLRIELPRHPPIRVHGCATRGSEGVCPRGRPGPVLVCDSPQPPPPPPPPPGF